MAKRSRSPVSKVNRKFGKKRLQLSIKQIKAQAKARITGVKKSARKRRH